MIEYGSVYLVVRDFEKSLAFYKKLLEKEVSAQNKTRFAIFHVGSLCLCLLNGKYDIENPDTVKRVGEYIRFSMILLRLRKVRTAERSLSIWERPI